MPAHALFLAPALLALRSSATRRESFPGGPGVSGSAN